MRRFLISIGLVALGVAQPQSEGQPASARTVGRDRDGEVRVSLPVARGAFGLTVLRLSEASRVPLGLEMLAEPSLPSRVVRQQMRPEQEVHFTGRSLGESLKVLVDAVGGYRSVPRDAMIVLRPLGASESFLDERAGDFALERVPIEQALLALHRFINPDYPTTAAAPGRAGNVVGRPDEDVGEILRRQHETRATPVSVSLKNATAIDILNALVLSAGRFSWVVDYTNAPATYRNSRIAIVGWDGTRIEFPSVAR